jgi:hypothetical protein
MFLGTEGAMNNISGGGKSPKHKGKYTLNNKQG